jgi:hypothetical protein
MATVSRRDRMVDLAALLLIVGGVALYLVAAAKLRSISLYSRANPGPPGALVAADRARYLSYGGLALVAVGSCIGVVRGRPAREAASAGCVVRDAGCGLRDARTVKTDSRYTRARRRLMMLGSMILGAMFLLAPALHAQEASLGRLEGVVTGGAERAGCSPSPWRSRESIRSLRSSASPAPIRSGAIASTRFPPAATCWRPPSALLDSLRLAVGAREVRIAAGETVRFDVALPSDATLRAAAVESAARSVAQAPVDTATGELELIGAASVAGEVRGAAGEPLAGVPAPRSRRARCRDERLERPVPAHRSARRSAGARRASARLCAPGTGRHAARGCSRDRPIFVSSAPSRSTRCASPRSAAAFASSTSTAGANIFGRYLTRDQILRRRPADGADLLFRLGGFTVIGHGDAARVFTKVQMRNRAPCEANVVVDRVQHRRINDVPPPRIVGLEAYEGPSSFHVGLRIALRADRDLDELTGGLVEGR